jgi:NAD(P)-dependent dehydrogenase (short-subunit alcohol dehydrogenase family)
MEVKQTTKVVLISGATSGIGRETALFLARKGLRVYAGYRHENRGLELLEETQKEGLNLSIVALDVALAHHPQQAVDLILKETGRLDILINNAGYGLAGPIENLDMDQVHAEFETNVFGLLRLSKAVIPIMRKQRSGLLIHISSVSGRFGYPFLGAYSASKFAVEAFGEAMRYELAPFGIRSVLIEPGMVKTDFVERNLVITHSALHEESPYHRAGREAKEKFHGMGESGIPPIRLARLIWRIIKKRNPRLRYPIGGDGAFMITLKRFLPDSWIEWLILKAYGLKKHYAEAAR